MMLLLLALSVVLLGCLAPVSADNFAVLVAGSNTYSNYRHQADVCHSYKLLRRYGVPEANILTFIFDDIAFDNENPYPGRLFNKPTNNMTRGVDVYVGCGGSLDSNVYRGKDVLPSVWVAAITGNVSGVPAGKAVLRSTKTDEVFLSIVDHGSPGTVYFPGFIPFQATALNAALQTMASRAMFSKLVFYLEACEAGSIFDKLLPTNIEVYAVTASNTDESSWGTYCPGEEKANGGAYVDGVDIGSCLGDLFSVNWMEDADKVGVDESLEIQYLTVKNLTSASHVMQYGDTAFTDLPTGNFIASMSSNRLRRAKQAVDDRDAQLNTAAGAVPARDIPLHVLTAKYKKAAAGSVEKRAAMRKLRDEVVMRARVDDVFETFAEAAVANAGLQRHEAADLFAMPATPIVHDACMNAVEDVWRGQCGGWNEYSTQYGAVIINACRMNNDAHTLAKAMAKACTL